MDYYTLKIPVVAARYRHQENEQEFMAVVASTGRTGHSYSNTRGYLHIYNGGPELAITDGSWAVAIGGDVTVLSDEQFTERFKPSPST